MLKKCLSCLLLLLLVPQNVFSFGKTGHRVSAKIASHYLTKSSKKAINDLMGDESLAEASTYVDEMRSNPEKFWQETALPYHYVTVADGKKYQVALAPKQGDAFTALTFYSAILTDEKTADDQKTLALKFIVHIIGDLHQPLHVGNGKDRGGNDVKVQFFGSDSNLHRVWDSALIDKQKLSYTEWSNHLNRQINKEQIAKWQTIDPLVWIAESYSLRQQIYPVNSEISWDYQYKYLPSIKQRLKQAGVRIAHYLNHIFDPKGNSK